MNLTVHGKGGDMATVRLDQVETDGGGARWMFIVESGCYRAELPPCSMDYCESGEMVPCPLDRGHSRIKGGCDGGDSLTNGFCHAWHWEKVERFARKVLATRGAKPPRVKPVGVPRGSIANRAVWEKVETL